MIIATFPQRILHWAMEVHVHYHETFILFSASHPCFCSSCPPLHAYNPCTWLLSYPPQLPQLMTSVSHVPTSAKQEDIGHSQHSCNWEIKGPKHSRSFIFMYHNLIQAQRIKQITELESIVILQWHIILTIKQMRRFQRNFLQTDGACCYVLNLGFQVHFIWLYNEQRQNMYYITVQNESRPH